MRMLTLKLKPKQIFGCILLLTGLAVVLITFLGNHPAKPASASMDIPCETLEQRTQYINSLGYEIGEDEQEKDIVIPSVFNDVYNRYNEIQKEQGFDLNEYKGRNAKMFTYNVTNYKNNDNVIANLLVCDGVLIGADLCDTSARDGFLVALDDKNR